MPSQWNHKADKDLLLTIIEDGNLTHIDWQSVSAKLRAMEYTFSHEACRQHYQKIRRESKNGSGSSNGNGNGNGNLTTPTKPTASKKTTPASKRSNAKAFTNSSGNSNNEDDEENMVATPTAKRKRSVKKEKAEPQDMGGFADQTAAQFKIEHADGGNGYSFSDAVDLDEDSIYAA